MFKKIIFLLFPFITLSAQEVTNVRLSVEGDKVIVLYDIENYSTHWLYDVSITFQSTTKITPFALSGDVGKDVVVGKDRKIVWDIYQDIDGISGNLKAEVTITKGTQLKHIGLASNALLSAVLPGLGDYYVYEHKWHPILVHSAFAFGTAFYFLNRGEQIHQYKLYKSSINQTDIDSHYDKYKSSLNLQNFALIGVAAIYAYDIAFVFINGKMNKKDHPYFGKKNSNRNSAMYLTPSPALDGMQLSYILNF